MSRRDARPETSARAERPAWSPLDRFRGRILDAPPGLQVVPADWAAPLDLAVVFGRRPARLEVDLGCGKGRFLLARAAACPRTMFLGIDQSAGRLALLARRARRAGLDNIRLLYAESAYAMRRLLPPDSVAVCYVFFPDPWPKRRHRRRRLFHPGFLDALHQALAPGGEVQAATDQPEYGDVIRGLFERDSRFVPCPPRIPAESEQTDFEVLFLAQNLSISRCAFQKAARIGAP